MIRILLKSFKRNLFKNKVISGINIFGLVLGILSTALILEYVFYQRSYDDFNENAHDIYRVAYNRYQDNELQWKTANSFFPTGRFLLDNYPEVVNYVSISRKYNILVTYVNSHGDKISFNEDKSYYASSSLFDVFSYELLQGEKNALDDPDGVVISERAAGRYFGNDDPVGKELIINNFERYTVKGIFKTIPRNSHIQSDFFFSLERILAQNPNLLNNWGYDYQHAYIQLAPDTDYKKLEKEAFPHMIRANYEENLTSTNSRDEFYLQPLTDIHLYSNIEYETEPPGNGKAINILFGFAIFFLLFAWINFINLSSAKAVERAKEIAIKKANGYSKRVLIFQFVFETLIFNLISLTLAFLLWVYINPYYMSWTGIERLSMFLSWREILVFAVIFLVGVMLSGLYPAFILSSYKPATILRGKFVNARQGILFRNGLVTVQFVVSIILLVGTLISRQQVNFLINKDIGLNYSSKLAITAPKWELDQEVYNNKLNVLQNELKENPMAASYTFSSGIPGKEIESWFYGWRQGFEPSVDGKAYFRIDVDHNFMDFYDIELLAGRFFRESDLDTQRYIVLNEKGMQRLGYTDPEEAIGKIMVAGYPSYEIIGIVKDFHYYSVKVDPVPTVLTLINHTKQYMCIRLEVPDMNRMQTALNSFKASYEEVFPGSPFDYVVLDQHVVADLKTDKTFATVFSLFSLIAIAVSVIGILGLIIIMIYQSQKDMSIRKVFGAELHDILKILSKKLSRQFLIGILIAVPVSVYGFQKWFLNNYTDHVKLIWVHFALPIIILGLIMILIICIQSLKVMRMNVTKTLDTE